MQIDRFYVAHEHPGEQLRTGPGRILTTTDETKAQAWAARNLLE